MQIKYNDPAFDVENHPIADWQRKVIEQAAGHFALQVDWYYEATLHGGIFWCDAPPLHCTHDVPRRLSLADLVFLTALPGFRWIEAGQSRISIGLEHKQG